MPPIPGGAVATASRSKAQLLRSWCHPTRARALWLSGNPAGLKCAEACRQRPVSCSLPLAPHKILSVLSTSYGTLNQKPGARMWTPNSRGSFYHDTYERTPSLQKQPYVVFKLARNRSSRQSCTDAAARFVSVVAFSYRGPTCGGRKLFNSRQCQLDVKLKRLRDSAGRCQG